MGGQVRGKATSLSPLLVCDGSYLLLLDCFISSFSGKNNPGERFVIWVEVWYTVKHDRAVTWNTYGCERRKTEEEPHGASRHQNSGQKQQGVS
jgi:hypothetical protein